MSKADQIPLLHRWPPSNHAVGAEDGEHPAAVAIVLHLRLGQNTLSDALRDGTEGEQVDLVAEEGGQLLLDVEGAEAGFVVGFVLDQDVDVAVGAEVVAEDGAEEGEAADVVAVAEGGQRVGRDGERGVSVGLDLGVGHRGALPLRTRIGGGCS